MTDTGPEVVNSLADELIADLDDLGDGSEDEVDAQPESANLDNSEMDVTVNSATTDEDNVKAVAPLFFSSQFKAHMEAVSKASTTEHGPIVGPVEQDDEYNLIVKSNELVAQMENEVVLIHKYVRDKYAKKFPELEQLVVSPVDYIRTVKCVGNETDLNAVDLNGVLPSQLVMIVTVTSSTTSGVPLADEELTKVFEACDTALALEDSKKQILDYVASRMSLFAPNLSALVGTAVAARLMGIAGGLVALSKIPGCNVQVLGNSKKILSGFSSVGTDRHIGVIQFADIIRDTPAAFRSKAVRVLAGKLVLCARVDAYGEKPDGSVGAKFKEDIAKKIEKWQEPPPAKRHKALPIPDAQHKKKRGGRRYRAMKERMAVTELQKRANRMEFGRVEDDAVAGGMGAMGPPSSGRLRNAPLENKGVARNTKKMQARLKAYGGSSGATSGVASSLAFTPVQGIELENPEAAAEKVREANATYFGSRSFAKK